MKLSENRLLVAAPIIPILYLLITRSPPLLFFFIVSAAIIRAQFEFYRLHCKQGHIPRFVYFGLMCGFLLLCIFYFNPAPWFFWASFFLILMAVFIFNLFFFREMGLALLD
jgi:hypothetical protein